MLLDSWLRRQIASTSSGQLKAVSCFLKAEARLFAGHAATAGDGGASTAPGHALNRAVLFPQLLVLVRLERQLEAFCLSERIGLSSYILNLRASNCWLGLSVEEGSGLVSTQCHCTVQGLSDGHFQANVTEPKPRFLLQLKLRTSTPAGVHRHQCCEPACAEAASDGIFALVQVPREPSTLPARLCRQAKEATLWSSCLVGRALGECCEQLCRMLVGYRSSPTNREGQLNFANWDHVHAASRKAEGKHRRSVIFFSFFVLLRDV